MTSPKFVPAICPRCGASLSLPEDLKNVFCSYCGTEFIIEGGAASKKVQCRVCDGFGRLDICRACDGRGKCSWRTRGGGYRNNDLLLIGFETHCSDGICHACRGTGRYGLSVCPGCNGAGKCPSCMGTGKCSACHGHGIIPGSNGSEKCLACGGTGLTDARVSVDISTGRCRICKRPWTAGGSYCTHCGHVERCPQGGARWDGYYTRSCEKCGYIRGDVPGRWADGYDG